MKFFMLLVFFTIACVAAFPSIPTNSTNQAFESRKYHIEEKVSETPVTKSFDQYGGSPSQQHIRNVVISSAGALITKIAKGIPK